MKSKFTKEERNQMFHLYYWVWERKVKPLPSAAKELGISLRTARYLLEMFINGRVRDDSLGLEYYDWKLHQEGKETIPRPLYGMIKAKLDEAVDLLSHAIPSLAGLEICAWDPRLYS
jgi:hypothetical protein